MPVRCEYHDFRIFPTEEARMNPVDQWHYETLGKAACEALKKNGFEALYVANGREALDRVASMIKPGMRIGFGGSMTVKAIGVQEKAKAIGAEILDHNAPGLDAGTKMEILRAQLVCDLFVSGSNAITLEGDIVNVDGNGNRVAALTFGPKKIVVVVGANKVVRDIDEALARVETTAAPMNNKRLDKPNPCVKTGTCEDCRGETRICRIYQILRRKPSLSDFTVIVVGESLGF
jgi:L-lactate utilization protein LutB